MMLFGFVPAIPAIYFFEPLSTNLFAIVLKYDEPVENVPA
jgi:hypothetical protein